MDVRKAFMDCEHCEYICKLCFEKAIKQAIQEEREACIVLLNDIASRVTCCFSVDECISAIRDRTRAETKVQGAEVQEPRS